MSETPIRIACNRTERLLPEDDWPEDDCETAFGSAAADAAPDEANARTTEAPTAPAGNTTARALVRRFHVRILNLPNDLISLQPNRKTPIADLRLFAQLGKTWNQSRAEENLE
jgi:hypothetical protein